jgi:murein L,D-transpeptidase YafK
MVIDARQGALRMSTMILDRGTFHVRVVAAICAAVLALLTAGCSNAPEIPPADKPLSKGAIMLLGKKGMDAGAPIFVRIFKEDSELEVWKARDDGRFYHYKTYPICNWSGDLGPKLSQGDKQAPEGFYTVAQTQMNPTSGFHLAFNLGYPNAYDRSHRRTGNFLMVHGKCKSAGCYAMTDALIEEIYALAREAFKGGQTSFQVHAFPFRMTAENMARHGKNKWMPFWSVLKQGYDHFEMTRVPPEITVCERKYLVNARLLDGGSVSPDARCPAIEHPQILPFTPRPGEQQVAEERIRVPGPKMKAVAQAGTGGASTGGWSAGGLLGLGSSGGRSSAATTAFGFNP